MIATEFLRKHCDSKAVALKEYYDYSPIFTYKESCSYFRETIVTVRLLITENKKEICSNSHFFGNQSGIAGVHCMVVDPYKAKKRYTVTESLFLCTRRKLGFNKKIRTELAFRPQQNI